MRERDFLPALFQLEDDEYRESEEERAVRESIDAINAKKPLEREQLAIAQSCMSLARSIHLGNVKGRSIANEVAQLRELMQLLAHGDDDGAGGMPVSVKGVFDALSAPPRADTPTASYPA